MKSPSTPLPLYDRFAGQARRAVDLARREARRLRHDYLSTEHLLLGVLKEPSGGLVELLASHGTDPDHVCRAIEPQIVAGAVPSKWNQLPLTPAVQRTFVYAREEAAALGHRCVGPEHLLLAVLREPDCRAVELLTPLGLTLAALREAARRLPEPENRDWQMSSEAAPLPSAKADPSARDLDAVLTADPLPRKNVPGRVIRTRVHQTPRDDTGVSTEDSPVTFENSGYSVVGMQLRFLQFLIAVAATAGAGALLRGLPGALMGAVLGFFVVLLRNTYVIAVLGCIGGIEVGRRVDIELGLDGPVLGGLVGLLVGVAVGDWSTLRPPRRPE
jgi:hypothetical protein